MWYLNSVWAFLSLDVVQLMWGGRGSRRWGNLGGKTNIIIDENTKPTIKGILGSFTPIDLDQQRVKGLLESSGVTH